MRTIRAVAARTVSPPATRACHSGPYTGSLDLSRAWYVRAATNHDHADCVPHALIATTTTTRLAMRSASRPGSTSSVGANDHATAPTSVTTTRAMSALALQRGVSPTSTRIGIASIRTTAIAVAGISGIPARNGTKSLSFVHGVDGMRPGAGGR